MRRILFATDKLTTGGAERYFITIENKLSRKNLELYCAAGSGDFEKEIKYKERFTLLSRSSSYENLRILYKLIKEKNIEMFHSNSLHMLLYGIVLRIRFPKLNLLYTKHNITILEKKMVQLFVFLLNVFVNNVITVGEDERKHLIKLGVQPKKITTIYNGVDFKTFGFTTKTPESSYKVGILARLSKEKNHRLFIEIAKHLQHKNFTFHIAGDGEEKQALEELVRRLKLGDKVTFYGNVTEPQKFLAEMDVILLTSEREVFPMTILEAMAVGTPVISIDVGGVGEAIENHITGSLVSAYDPKLFVEEIEDLMQNPAYRKQIIENAYLKVKKEYSEQNMLEKTEKMYVRGEMDL